MSNYYNTGRIFSHQFSSMLEDILTYGSNHELLKRAKDELYFLIDLVDFIDKRTNEPMTVGKTPDHTTIEESTRKYHETPDHTTFGDLMK